MRKILAAFAIATVLGGCSTLSEIEGASVSPQAANIAVSTAAAIEAAGTSYMQLCAAKSTLCNMAAAAKIAPAIRTIHVAARQVVAALHSSNGAAIPIASYDTLTSTITILQSIYAQNNITIPATN